MEAKFDIFPYQSNECLPILIANKILKVTVLSLIYFCYNLWLQKLVTADLTEVFVNNQCDIQQQ